MQWARLLLRSQSSRRATMLQRRKEVLLQGGVNNNNNLYQQQQIRCLAGGKWSGERGYDITHESLYFGGRDARPKIVLDGYGPTGFNVSNMIKNMTNKKQEDGSIFLHGSIMAFPHACFFWNVTRRQDITMESLSPIILYQPKIEILVIGCNHTIPNQQLFHIYNEMQDRYSIAVEKVELHNAIGTFNFLNAEDREVAVALLLDPKAKLR